MDQDTLVLRAALQYASWGLPVIPICSPDHVGETAGHLSRCDSPGKAPTLKGWAKIEYAETVNANTIIGWFQRNPGRNIGLPLGVTSGFIGIDIDGAMGEMYLSNWSKGDLPPTVEFRTGSGRRLLYRIPDGFTPKKKIVYTADGEEHQEVAILGQGQQTVLPPSVHPSGRSYSFEPGQGFHNFKKTVRLSLEEREAWLANAQKKNAELTLEDIPETEDRVNLNLIPIAPYWLLDLVDAKHGSKEGATTYTDSEDQSDAVSPEEWTKTIREGEGRHNALLRLTGSLIRGFVSDPYYTMQDALKTMLDHNLLKFEPPLPAAEVTTAVQDVWESEKRKLTRRRQRFVPVTVARQFISWMERREMPLRYVGAEDFFYQYQVEGPAAGTWKTLFEVDMNYQIGTYLAARDATWYTTSKVAEVTQKLKDILWKMYPESAFLFDVGHVDRNEWLKQTGYDPMKWIATQNLMLNWETMETRPFDYQYYALTKLSMPYMKDAVAPVWEKSVASWVSEDSHVEFLQQYCGSLLIPVKVPQVLYLIGEGANGKSLFTETIARSFQEEFISRSSFAQLMERFGLYGLKNKVVNVCTDESTKWLKDTGSLKAAVAGEPIMAEIKMKQYAPTIYPAAKFMVCSNHYPYTSDKSYGWLRRLSFINFHRNFIHEYSAQERAEFEKEFNKAILTEDSGRLNWMLQGLKKLAANNFKLPMSDSKTNREYQIANDDVAAFFSDVLEESEDGEWINAKYVERLFKNWCDMNDSRSKVKPVEFARRMKMLGIKKQPRRIGSAGKYTSVQAFTQVRLQQSHESKQVTSITYHNIPIEQLGTGALVDNTME